jgi:Tfp pilus assembly protein PilF
MDAANRADTRGRRLDTWKEIASFFGCDERTVKRWESTRGLPVRRIPNGVRSNVFAYEGELRSWLDSAREATAMPQPAPPAIRAGGSSFGKIIAAGFVAFAIAASAYFYLRTGNAFPEPAQRTANRIHRPSAEALAYYRAGLFEWQTRTPTGLRHAVDDFTQAIVRDPQYARAYAGLAQCYELLREYTTVTPDYAFPRAKAAADRAIALDPSLADAHLALAFAEFYWFHHSRIAQREFERALALAPGNAVAHHWYATFLLEMAAYPKAISEIDRAAALDTESIAVQADRGLILYYAGHRTESIDLLSRLEQTQPQFASTHRYLAKIDLVEHDEAGYLRELSLAAAATEDADGKAMQAAGARGLKTAGRRGMLQSMLQIEEPLARDGKGSAYALATMHAELGDGPGAVAWLRESLSRGEAEIAGLAIEPSFRNLRALPEFRSLAQKVGVPVRG